MRPLFVFGFVLLSWLAVSGSALAHPSDFQTLTLDLIFGPSGIDSIEGAVVESEGPGYLPFPSVALRRDVGDRVLGALDLSASDVLLDPKNSDRYHEVGFQATLGRGQVEIVIDTAALQQVTNDLGLRRLN